LFDMDGVLIDSTPAVARVWRKWAVAHSFEAEEVIRRAHGRPSITTVRELLPTADHEAENAVIERGEIEDVEGVVPLPGSIELLRQLPAHRWAIVTSSTRRLAEVRVRTAGLPVPPLFITSSDITHGKPHPEPYIKAAEKLGFPSADCIVVEDTAAGVEAGRRSGARVIAFPTTMEVHELRRAGANWIVANCGALTVRSAKARLNIEVNEIAD